MIVVINSHLRAILHQKCKDLQAEFVKYWVDDRECLHRPGCLATLFCHMDIAIIDVDFCDLCMRAF